MYRVKENPLSRFPVSKPLEDDTGNWVVAHLRSRREKLFASEMAREGVGYYLPLFEKRTNRRDNGKIRKSINPLFPGYIAIVREKSTEQFIYKSPHLANIIPVKNQNNFVNDLLQIQRILDSNVSFELHGNISPGDKVKVVLGPFAGIEGQVTKIGKSARLILAVEMFGQAISVAINTNDLIKV